MKLSQGTRSENWRKTRRRRRRRRWWWRKRQWLVDELFDVVDVDDAVDGAVKNDVAAAFESGE